MEQIQLTQCLAQQLPDTYDLLAENRMFKIISVPSSELDSIALLADKAKCGRFTNVTHQFEGKKGLLRQTAAQQLLARAYPKTPREIYTIHHQTAVQDAINQVDVNRIISTLTQMTRFENRSATKQSGLLTARWLKTTFEAMANSYQRQDTATWFVKTGLYYKQPSLVTVIGKDIDAPAIVIGAHMDTLDGKMPGAGDDASGSASIMEMARIVLQSSTALKRPVYFIWYAAEERGLVGSQYVVQDFLSKNSAVKAAIQFDMTGFRNDASDETMWVYEDYTDKSLSDFLENLITTYIGVPVGKSACGYGCSDHASWMKEGIPAVFPCETDFEHHNTAIHSALDTMDRLTPEHMVNFTRLGLAFIMELALD